MNSQLKGYIFGILAAALYGMNPLFTLPLYSDGMAPDSVLFLRYIIAIPVLGTMVIARKRSFEVKPQQLGLLAVLGLLMGFSSLALFTSYTYIDAGIASTILFVYPIMVALIMAALFHERLTLHTVICLASAMSGIYLLYNGSSGTTLSTAGTVWVMLSSLSYAIYIVAVNTPMIKNIATLPLTFYVLLFGSLIFAVCLIVKGTMQLPSSLPMWLCAVSLAVLPTAASLILTTVAIQKIGSTATAILGVFEPVTAIFFGIIIFHEQLTVRDIIGLLMIMIAVCLVIGGKNVAARIIRIKKMFPPLKKH